MSRIRDSRPPDRCDACVETETRHAKMQVKSANLLVEWANLVAKKERQIKLLKAKEILATGGDPGDYYQESESE